MQVSVENFGHLGRRLTVSVPNQQLKSAIQAKMNEIAKKEKVAGFRQGKIPQHVLEQRFGTKIKQEAVGQIIEISLPKALEEKDLKPAGRPVVEQIQNKGDEDLSYTVSFEIFPQITLGDFSKIQIEKYQVNVTEKDIDKALEKLREQLSEWVVVDRKAAVNDRLIVDYTSTMQGKTYENSSAQDIFVNLGSNSFIEGFEEGLIGSKAGDKKELALTFPKDWRLEKFAGKAVEFTVHVKAVTEKHLAELNETLAKKIGATSADLNNIKSKIRENLEKQLEETKSARLKDQVADALLKMNPIPVPKALRDREAEILHEEMHRRMGNQGDAHCHHPDLESEAEKRVALGLILNEVIKTENIKADETIVKNKIDSIAKMFGNADFIDSMYYESSELLTQVRHSVLLEKALEIVVNRATQVEKTISVDELFNRQS